MNGFERIKQAGLDGTMDGQTLKTFFWTDRRSLAFSRDYSTTHYYMHILHERSTLTIVITEHVSYDWTWYILQLLFRKIMIYWGQTENILKS